jgi:hypothetical protein
MKNEGYWRIIWMKNPELLLLNLTFSFSVVESLPFWFVLDSNLNLEVDDDRKLEWWYAKDTKDMVMLFMCVRAWRNRKVTVLRVSSVFLTLNSETKTKYLLQKIVRNNPSLIYNENNFWPTYLSWRKHLCRFSSSYGK